MCCVIYTNRQKVLDIILLLSLNVRALNCCIYAALTVRAAQGRQAGTFASSRFLVWRVPGVLHLVANQARSFFE